MSLTFENIQLTQYIFSRMRGMNIFVKTLNKGFVEKNTPCIILVSKQDPRDQGK